MVRPICPNCTAPVSKPNAGCLLHDLIQVARDRATISEPKLRELHASVDTDALWNRLGNIVDDLEAGYYHD